MRLGTIELVVIIGVVFLLFGGKIVPMFAKKVRETSNAIKKEMEPSDDTKEN